MLALRSYGSMTESFSLILLFEPIPDATKGGGARGRDFTVSFELKNFKRMRYMGSKNVFIMKGIIEI